MLYTDRHFNHCDGLVPDWQRYPQRAGCVKGGPSGSRPRRSGVLQPSPDRLTQVEVGPRLRRPPSVVSKQESGERRVDVVGLMEFARLHRRNLNVFIRYPRSLRWTIVQRLQERGRIVCWVIHPRAHRVGRHLLGGIRTQERLEALQLLDVGVEP